jgi:hypothetical protein
MVKHQKDNAPLTKWRRIHFRIGLVLGSILVALFFAEIVVRVGRFDWRLIRNLLYFQTVDLDAHMPDPNPELLFRLRPRAKTKYVTIDEFGARGFGHPLQKDRKVFRIVVVGGSNAYGAEINNESDPWPARLETALNDDAPGRFEVWNFGTSAYVPSQMAVIAEEAMDHYDPDLIIFALTNIGWRAFLEGVPIEPYFMQHPTIWNYYFTPEFIRYPKWLSYENNIRLIAHSSLYRMVLFNVLVRKYGLRPRWNEVHERDNVAKTRAFFQKTVGRVSACIFIGPAFGKEFFHEYYEHLDVPLFYLSSDGRPPEYHQNHPPNYVMLWYASEIKKWLIESHLVPQAILDGQGTAADPGTGAQSVGADHP